MTVSNAFFIALGYLPLLALFFVNLWQRPYYQFFPLAICGAAFLAWTRLKSVPRPLKPGHGVISLLLLGLSFILLACSTLLWSPWLASIATLIGLAGGIWWVGGPGLLRAMCPALLL